MPTKEHVAQILQEIYDFSEAQAIYQILLEAWNESLLSEDSESIQLLIQRLKNFEPIQYILKRTYFYDSILYLEYPVLIPRPETEELVHWAIQDKNDSKTIWDIGTGSGCIALTLVRKLTHSKIIASDINPDALSNLKINLDKIGANTTMVQHDILLDEIPKEVKEAEIIISNPPYISIHEKEEMEPNVLLHEPHNALFAQSEDAIIFYRKIAYIAENICTKVQKIYLELNPIFYKEIMDLFHSEIWKITLKKDMQGKNRLLKCERKGSII